MIKIRLQEAFVVIWIVLMCLSSQVSAVPANPFLQEVIQADGNVVTIAGRGDEFFNWVEDNDGYVVAYDENTKNWCYAYISDEKILPSSIVIGNDNQKSARSVPFQRITANDFNSLIEKVNTSQNKTEVSVNNSYSKNARSFASAKLRNMNPSLLIVLLEYSDAQIVKGMNYWESHFFGNSQGQLNSYFNEVSNGKFQYKGLRLKSNSVGNIPTGISEIELYADGIVRVRLNKAHPKYQSSTSLNYDNTEKDLITAFNAVKQYFDFTPFASDLFYGYIPMSNLTIYTVVAGWEASNTSNTDSRKVWAHARYSYVDNTQLSLTYPGLQLTSHAVQGEIYSGSMSSSAKVMGVGVSAHELGHTLGLPDLYDTSPNKTRAVGPYSLMANGSWGAGAYDESGHKPTHLDAWSKVYLGFVEPIEIRATSLCDDWKGNLRTISANGGYNVLKLTSTVNTQQYFLLENRGLDGYDGGFYSYGITSSNNNGGGILVWHIDESITDNRGRPDNTNWQRRGVTVEQADGSTMLEKTSVYKNDYVDYCHFFSNTAFKGRMLNEFSSYTTPNSNFYNGSSSGVSVKINSPRNPSMEVEVVSPYLSGHNFSLWQETITPTCETEGEKTEKCSSCGALGTITQVIPKLTQDCGTPISPKRTDNRYGIKFTQSIVSDKAEISVILPNEGNAIETKFVIYDMIGNIVAKRSNDLGSQVSKGRSQSLFVWNLQNQNGRIVANGTYLVIAEVKSQDGQSYYYSAKLGVKR